MGSLPSHSRLILTLFLLIVDLPLHLLHLLRKGLLLSLQDLRAILSLLPLQGLQQALLLFLK
jgi:hypothetical protein